ncbi:unnamed protein product [Gadus morhua 'NCC']
MTFTDIERVTTKLNVIHKVNMDELYDECSTAKPILKRLKEDAEDEWKSKGVAARIFSRMANKWSDCRNRCSTELMRSELLITLNFEQSCSEFYNSALKDKELLSAARNNKKYTWKKK